MCSMPAGKNNPTIFLEDALILQLGLMNFIGCYMHLNSFLSFNCHKQQYNETMQMLALDNA